jgi:hypothetical protein
MRFNKPRGHKDKGALSLKWAYQSIAKLGGFTDTKRTGIANWTAVLEGWSILQSQVVGYRVARASSHFVKKIELFRNTMI